MLRRSAGFAVIYGAATGIASVGGALWLRHGIDANLRLALLLFTAGAAIAGFLTPLLISWWGRRWPMPARFAAAIISLILLSAGFHTILLFVDYIGYYVQWWPPAFSLHWAFTILTTFAGVAFFYVAVGIPMLLPLGLPVVFASAYFLAARR